MLTEPGSTRVRTQGADARPLLEQALHSLKAAVESVHADPDAAMDDLMAARLLVSGALVALLDELELPAPDVAAPCSAAADGSSSQ